MSWSITVDEYGMKNVALMVRLELEAFVGFDDLVSESLVRHEILWGKVL